MSRPFSPILSAPAPRNAHSHFLLLVTILACSPLHSFALLSSSSSSGMQVLISKNIVQRGSTGITSIRRCAVEKLVEPVTVDDDDQDNDEHQNDDHTATSDTPRRRHLARGLLLSSFSDGLVPNPHAIDFFMDSLVESMWNQHLQDLENKVESSVLASPCCGPTDVDSFNQLMDTIDDDDDDDTDGNNHDSTKQEGNQNNGKWKAKFQKLLEMTTQPTETSPTLELRFLYIPTAMYAIRKDSNNSPGKQRQRARADGKKRRTQIVNLIQDQFAQAYKETILMNGCGGNDDKSREEIEPSLVNVLTVSFDFDDGSLKQPEGSKDTSKFPSTGLEALKDWKPHLIYVQGGNTFWLYHCMDKGGWRDALVDAVTFCDNNETPAVYCGTSAGAILAGSLMETATWKEWDDPTVDPSRPNYNDWKEIAGLDLAGENVSVFPHMSEQWQELVDGKMEHLCANVDSDSDSSLPAPEVYCLRDNQAVCINGKGQIPTRTLLEC